MTETRAEPSQTTASLPRRRSGAVTVLRIALKSLLPC